MRLLSAVVLCFLLLNSAATCFAEEFPKPNVVLIISDDQHYGDYGFMGHDKIETPHLDRLASESMVFRRGYVSASLCCPSLSTMVTGLYPRQSGITGNLPRIQQKKFAAHQSAYIQKMEQVPTLPRLLSTRGYVSLQTGKWWCGSYKSGGFTQGMTHGEGSRGGRHGDEGLKIGRQGLEPISEFIDRAKADEKPFLVWYAPFMPHAPHTPPKRLVEKYLQKTDSRRQARYWAMCDWFDETCGELLAMLESKQVAENTIVVYICDNGWIAAERGNSFGPKSKLSPYDGGLRTPIMIRWPGKVAPGEADGLASNLDIVPTVLDAVGIAPPKNLRGMSLLAEANRHRKQFAGAIYSHDAVDIDDPSTNLLYRWCIDGKWKLIEPNAARLPDEPVHLFDIKADPTEEHDLASDHPEVVMRLVEYLDREWAATEGAMP